MLWKPDVDRAAIRVVWKGETGGRGFVPHLGFRLLYVSRGSVSAVRNHGKPDAPEERRCPVILSEE